MEEVKRKRGRPKKVKIPEEIEKVINIINETKEKEEKEFHQIVEDIKQEHRQGEWDFPLDKEIPFFDSRLSYELTGYKPIDDKRGLDFDPTWYTEAKQSYLRTGHYCQFAPGTKSYSDFWQKEYVRCRDGMTVNGYTITGDHYYFLNYYRLENLQSASKAGGGRRMDFPDFLLHNMNIFIILSFVKDLEKMLLD